MRNKTSLVQKMREHKQATRSILVECLTLLAKDRPFELSDKLRDADLIMREYCNCSMTGMNNVNY